MNKFKAKVLKAKIIPAIVMYGLLPRSITYIAELSILVFGLVKKVSFLRDIRIGNAKNLLRSEYLSVSQVAEQCGFSGTSYFIQIFHKTVGESPERYRRRLLSGIS
jgi:AraC-like DNA-binding protein